MAGKNEDRVVAAATQVFLRYGYKRVTMAEIAEAARMSRPALYLVFPSKEDILTAVITKLCTSLLDEIRPGLDRFETVEEKLVYAFDVWNVRGFELLEASPDAKDLYESTLEIASEVTNKATAVFVAILAEVLEPLVKRQKKVKMSSVQIAQVMTNAVPGFKRVVKTKEQFRQLIAGLITITLASLDSPTASQAKPTKKPDKNK